MKKYIAFFLTTLLSQTALATAEEKMGKTFLNVNTGLSLSNNLKGNYLNDMGNSVIIGVGVKHQIMPKLKLGADFSYRPGYKYSYMLPVNFKGTQEINISSIILNATYDICTIQNKITPYVELGVGISRISLGAYSLLDLDTGINKVYNGGIVNNFTSNAGIGFSFDVSEKTNIDLAYKYSYFGIVDKIVIHSNKEKGTLNANEFLISLSISI